jgi:L-ascorbate metabolism protein UlaG (beta-lactamase superfamily)
MKITYYVNTMALIEGGRTRVLCDPWVTFGRRTACDFYNFPETSLTPEAVRAIAPDFIYLTHSHPDHFDPVTLDLFDKRTPIIIARFDNPFFEKAIRRLGFADVRAADPQSGLPMGGEDRAWIWPSLTYPDVDSIAVFRVDGETVANFNDNPFHAGQCRDIRTRFESIDVGLLPFGAHGPYPMFFQNLDDETAAAKARERKLRAYAAFAAFVRELGVRIAIPFAGGLVAAGPRALRYVHSGIGTRGEAIAHVGAGAPFTGVLLSEGCSYDTRTGLRHGDYVEKTHRSESAYLEWIARQPTRFDAGGAFHIAPSEQSDLSWMLERAREKQRKWQEIKKIDSKAVFYIDTGQALLYRLSLADDKVARVAERDIGDEKYQIYRMPYPLLLGLLTRHYNWSNVKTQYMWYYRKPDLFDPQLELMMSFLHL